MSGPFSKWMGLGILAGLTLSALSGCGGHQDPWPERSGLKVMVSFPPLYCFASKIAGDDATVLTLLDTTGVHDYQPTPRDAIKLHRADVFFINGLDLDNQFATLLVNNAANPKLKVYNVGEFFAGDPERKKLLRKYPAGHDHGHAHDHKHGHGHDHGHAHSHGEFDPHIWLGLPEALLTVDFIRDKLVEADPAHAADFKQRAAAYKEQLKELHKHAETQFAKVKERKLLTFHDSLSYFARPFKLEILETIQPTPGEDAGSKRIQDLVNLCLKEKVRVIAVEPNQLSNTAANTLLDTLKSKGVADARIVEVDVMESVPPAQLTPDFYTERMKQNIDKLAEALTK